MLNVFVKIENVCSNIGQQTEESWLLEVSDLGRISLSVSGKKCYFCDVITATLLFGWLRLQGVFFFSSLVRN